MARLLVAATVVVTVGHASAGGREEDAMEPNPRAAAGFDVSAGSRATTRPDAPADLGGAADLEGTADPSVTVDLSVLEAQGAGPARRARARPGGLLMPEPGVFPQSELHEPDPSHLPYATLTPRRQRPVTLRPPGSRPPTAAIRALALTDPPPPRPPRAIPDLPARMASARPAGEPGSIGRDPRAIVAPSRVGAVVGPTSAPPQTLGPDDGAPAAPPSPRPGGPEAVAASDPGSDAAATDTATETAAVSPPSPESVEPAGPPPPAGRAPAGATEQAAAPPALPAEQETVSLQPASRGEQATLPAVTDGRPIEELVQVQFEAAETDLSQATRAELKDLAERLRSREDMRLQLLAYAEGEGLSPSQARRMSLSRALAVRSYLIENGIKSNRIDLRALGNKAPSAPLDRVDVKVVQR